MQPSQACRAVYCRECSLPSAAGRRSELAEFTCLFPLWLVAEPPFPAPIHFAFSSVLLNGLEKVTIKKKKSVVQITKVSMWSAAVIARRTSLLLGGPCAEVM